MTGFGLDLAGFSKPAGTVLVGFHRAGSAGEATILTGSPFGVRLRGDFRQRVDNERRALGGILNKGRLTVDVPIDLQGLPKLDSNEPWRLTQRPVDRSMKGLPPLASLLGACVARFAATISKESMALLGSRLFESYPAASLKRMLPKSVYPREYKATKKQQQELGDKARLDLCNALGIISGELSLTHDEIDAIICGMTAVANDDELLPLNEYGLGCGDELPCGYRLLKVNPFTAIHVTRRPYADISKLYN